MSESKSKPRVNITYDETGRDGSTSRKELPFVVGVLGDFSGNPTAPLKLLKERKFVDVHHDNFDAVMRNMSAGLNLNVPDLLQDVGKEMAIRLKFSAMEDFSPARVAYQTEPLRKLLEARARLRDLQVKVDSREKADGVLEEVIHPVAAPEKAEAAAGATAGGAPEGDGAAAILDDVMAATAVKGAQGVESQGRLAAFMAEPAPRRALAIWLEGRIETDVGVPVPADVIGLPRFAQAVSRMLSRDIARIDALVNRQLNVILHHRRFQKLEASWRGLRYLLEHADPERHIKVKMLNMTWAELTRDMERAVEFDQSALFQNVYSEEFGRYGGEPYGILIGDYEVRHRPAADHPTDDLSTLQDVAGVAAQAFSPFICGADPVLLGLDHFGVLERPLNLSATFEQLEYTRWKSFRQRDDARFVGLALPRVLMRVPYGEDSTRADHFCFHEDVAGPDQRAYLWGNAAFAFGAVVMRAFADFGWMADIRGFRRDEASGGIVNDLPVCSFHMDMGDISNRFSTEVLISDAIEKELGELGFIPLCHCQYSDESVFYSNSSVNRPKVYDKTLATVNARMSGMMQYVLCVSRFSHYLKVQARAWIGGVTDAQLLEDKLSKWLNMYTADGDHASAETRAKFPLRQASVKVTEHPGHPGNYMCEMNLSPHYQMDTMAAGVQLKTELSPPRIS